MRRKISFSAWGHHNIRCLHETTVMITKDDYLTPKGDCIAAIKADRGPRDLPLEIRELSRSKDAIITLILKVAGKIFRVTGRGDPALSYTHPDDMVARKSEYTCDRTLMVSADRASIDIDRDMVRLLQNNNQRISVAIQVEL